MVGIAKKLDFYFNVVYDTSRVYPEEAYSKGRRLKIFSYKEVICHRRTNRTTNQPSSRAQRGPDTIGSREEGKRHEADEHSTTPHSAAHRCRPVPCARRDAPRRRAGRPHCPAGQRGDDRRPARHRAGRARLHELLGAEEQQPGGLVRPGLPRHRHRRDRDDRRAGRARTQRYRRRTRYRPDRIRALQFFEGEFGGGSPARADGYQVFDDHDLTSRRRGGEGEHAVGVKLQSPFPTTKG